MHQRGGSIIPTQRDAVTTTIARQLPFSLQVALDQNGQAKGSMYWDDGETLGGVSSLCTSFEIAFLLFCGIYW